MSANPLTDQLAAGVKHNMTGDHHAPRITKLGSSLARHLTTMLPDLDPETIGAVLLHASCFVASVAVDAAQVRGDNVQKEAKLVFNTLAVAGQQLYTETSGS